MVYTDFLAAMQQYLQKELGSEYNIQIQSVHKNNGLILDGISIAKLGDRAAPTIYLNSFYDMYQSGIPILKLQNELLKSYLLHSDTTPLHLEKLIEFDQLKERVLFKLIHTKSNTILLNDIPNIPFLDLSIVFYLLMEESDQGQMTALIHDDHLKSWNISITDLYTLARENACQLLPAQLRTMADVLRQMSLYHHASDSPDHPILDILEDTSELAPLYVLTNVKGINGASCILYDNILKDFADSLNSDLVILPSSIHEVLLIPYKEDLDCEGLSHMVTDINQAEVPGEDQLSNQVYLFQRTSSHFSILSNASSFVGASAAENLHN